jgi:hypothetical protein
MGAPHEFLRRLCFTAGQSCSGRIDAAATRIRLKRIGKQVLVCEAGQALADSVLVSSCEISAPSAASPARDARRATCEMGRDTGPARAPIRGRLCVETLCASRIHFALN